MTSIHESPSRLQASDHSGFAPASHENVGDHKQGNKLQQSLFSYLFTGCNTATNATAAAASSPEGVLKKIVTAGVSSASLAHGGIVHREAVNTRFKEEKWKLEKADLMQALRTPKAESASKYPALLQKLEGFSKTSQTAPESEELHEWVIAGENIADALFSRTPSPGEALKIIHGGKELEVECNSYTVRALSWYMMASAAAQDIRRLSQDASDTTSDMLQSGSLIMKDPDNRIYTFLKSGSYPRMSTHYNDRAGHDEKVTILGISVSSKVLQNGIEDFSRALPCESGCGTILFDKIKSEDGQIDELFVKFESTGTPPLNMKNGMTSFFAAAAHQLEHATSFLNSRNQNNDEKINFRQEHLYKGRLKHLYDEVVGLFTGDMASKVSRDMKARGLPAATEAVNKLINEAEKNNNEEQLDSAKAVQKNILNEMNKLGRASDQYKIQRRGAEVHITLKSDEVAENLRKAETPMADNSSHVARASSTDQENREEALVNPNYLTFERAQESFNDLIGLKPAGSSSPLTDLESSSNEDLLSEARLNSTAQSPVSPQVDEGFEFDGSGDNLTPVDNNSHSSATVSPRETEEEGAAGLDAVAHSEQNGSDSRISNESSTETEINNTSPPNESVISRDQDTEFDNSISAKSEQSTPSDPLQESAPPFSAGTPPSSPGKIRSLFSWLGSYMTSFTDWVRSLLRI